jgi:hypothetical protein
MHVHQASRHPRPYVTRFTCVKLVQTQKEKKCNIKLPRIRIYNNSTIVNCLCNQATSFAFFFFSLSPFILLGLSGTFYGRLAFVIFSCGAAGLWGTFPGYPRPPSLFSFFWTTQHEYNNIQHPWEAHPAWDSNPADLAVVSEECRFSFHHPTVSP